MLGLIFTTLLSLFCCSSIVNNVEVQQDKEIVQVEEKNILFATPGDFDGDKMIEAYFYNSDLLDYYLCLNFLNSIVDVLGQSYFGISVSQNGSYYFNNVNAEFISLEHNTYFQRLISIDKIQVDKSYKGTFAFNNTTMYESWYYFSFFNGSTIILQNLFKIQAPIGLSMTISVATTQLNQSYLGTGLFAYHEFNNNSVGPYIAYAYDQLYHQTVFPTSTYISQGYNTGYSVGYSEGKSSGYQSGYTAGYDDGVNLDTSMATIFSGILEVGLLPVNVFLQILNFEVFGINISGFVSALLTISIVIIIVRFLFGGGKSDK